MTHYLSRTAGLAMLTLTLAATAAPVAQAAAATIDLPAVTQPTDQANQQHHTWLTLPEVTDNTDQAHMRKPGDRIKLEATDNTRDLAGYKTADGKWQIAPKRLIRSAHLGGLTANDIKTLGHDYHVKSVVDFRTPGQVKGRPDKAIPGAKMTYLSILGPHAYADGKGDGEFYNQRLEFGYSAVMGYRQFLNQLLEEPGATLFHCSSGKDRTGIAAVLIMSALGMDRKTIIDDYMLSQTYHHHVEKSWIMEYYKEVLQNYGSMDNYMDQLLDFPAAKREKLRSLYLQAGDGTPYPGGHVTTNVTPTTPKPNPAPVAPQTQVTPAPVKPQVTMPQPVAPAAEKPATSKRAVVKVISVKTIKKYAVHVKKHHDWFSNLKLTHKLGTTKRVKTTWQVVKQAKLKVNGKTTTYVQIKTHGGHYRWIQLRHVTRV